MQKGQITMAFNFKKVAQESTVLSVLMQGRTKLSTDDVIDNMPDGITVTAFDIVHQDENTEYPVFLIAEDPNRFLMGGKVLSGIAYAWADGFDGDVEKASAELGNNGGVKIRLTRGKTKNNQNLTRVEVL